MTTTDKPLDLAAAKARWDAVNHFEVFDASPALSASLDDVPALVAEVQRLREAAREYLAAEDVYAAAMSATRTDGSFGVWANARDAGRRLQAAREALEFATELDANGAPTQWPVVTQEVK